ncbi:TPA: prevent-host-death protein [Candidatus Marinimicrobia bacterium]|nr:MAG: Prevent-host-death family protein [Marinimicrobia bacterium 46_43]HAE87420.1 prevent-host-death protein [Candidatus Neomarinimicrobiota bacterium]HBY19383.1 prevent-host-death protein [Candidatus Neomarinimicrobiota bacterium]
MKTISISKDIIPVGEFKKGLSKWLKAIRQSSHPVVITQNGRPAGVLLSPEEYDNLICTRHFIESVKRGLQDADTGETFTTRELRRKLSEIRDTGNNEDTLDS